MTAELTVDRRPAPTPRGGTRWIWVVGAIIAFVITTIAGFYVVGGFDAAPDPDTGISVPGANAFALVLAVALLVAIAAYATLEWVETRRLDSITTQFDTRTLVLIPIAIAFNIILGQAVASALKIPIYLDSIGTILVGVLAGPIAGLLTGLLSNLLWGYVVPPPFHSDTIAAFALVAAIIGLLAGWFARLGWMRPRPNRSTRELAIAGTATIAAILVLSYLALLGYQAILGSAALAPESDQTLFVILGWIALLMVVGTIIGLLYFLFVRRDLTAAYVVLSGVITGLVAAAISAPISANVYGGITGAGTDFLVAAFRQAGTDIQAATLGQGLISDPIDKVVTFFVVYLILGAMAVRTKARFPQGELLIADEETGV